MGLSGGGKKTRNEQTSDVTGTMTPNVPDWIKTPYQNYFSQLGNLSFNPGDSGPSELQSQAFGGAQHLMDPNKFMSGGMNATKGLLDFRQAAIDTGRPKFDASQGLDRFMNPFQQSVIDATTANMERARDQAITEGQAAATQAGAFGGSRHGVADSLTNREFFDSLGTTTAGLNAANFGQAQAARQSEVDRALSGAMFNRNMGQQNAQFRGQMANQLFGQGQAFDANRRDNLGLLSDLGGEQRDINMQSDPQNQYMQYLARMSALMAGGNPELFTGQTTNQHGFTEGWSKAPGQGFLGMLGSMANGMGNMGFSMNMGGK